MPEGIPIVAAYAGVIRMARGDSRVGGCEPRFAPEANYVVISHESGWETQYLHFSKVVVKAGDKVRAGELLGYSGATGWACGPHLHFKVARQVSPGWNNPSIAARIVGYGDPSVDTIVLSRDCGSERPLIATKVSPVEERRDPAKAGRGSSSSISVEPQPTQDAAGRSSAVAKR
jgi:murein DD-endopeptidase MepM/ murein hydrolase activator NlpD